MPDKYLRWNLVCKKCDAKFYTQQRGPPAPHLNIRATPNEYVCPKGHSELYFWSDFVFD